MALRPPASQRALRIRFAWFDVFWALAAPIIALVLRDAQVLNDQDFTQAALYCLVVFGISILCFVIFRLHQGVTGHFSVHDALNIGKIVVATALASIAILFLFTRLDGVPRSTPIIHALVLAAGLVGARLLYIFLDRSRSRVVVARSPSTEHVIMVGATKLTSLYIGFLDEFAKETKSKARVVALLDDQVNLLGESIAGIRVAGTTRELARVVDEYAVHGIHIDRVIIGGDDSAIAQQNLQQIEGLCQERAIRLEFVPDLVGLRPAGAEEVIDDIPVVSEVPVRPYFRVKVVLDLMAAAALIAILFPLWLLVSLLVLIDVGLPILFWQQRLGRHGRQFLLHKFRTMRSPYDWRGEPIPEDQRLSSMGWLLRKLRLDELPQLLNVFVGEMSLIGPRPLLPHDQPSNPEFRLSVRPGITGWAQVNGGRLLTPEEKDDLDEWYIRNASFWLDIKILLMTAAMIIRGEQRSEKALKDARTTRRSPPPTFERRSSGVLTPALRNRG